MNMYMKATIAMLMTGLVAATALAQPGPGGQGGPGGGPPKRGEGGRLGDLGGPGGGSGGQMDDRGPGPRGPRDNDDPFGGLFRNDPPEMQVVRLFRGYLDLVQQMTELARDPSASGVSAVMTANDILKARSNNDAIAFFADILPSVKDPVIQRAIRLQLVDLYKNSNQHDKALVELKTLIVPPGE